MENSPPPPKKTNPTVSPPLPLMDKKKQRNFPSFHRILFPHNNLIHYFRASLEEILYKRLATKLVISKDGDCWWDIPTTFLSPCKIDVFRFPFDEQECHVSIGSWTYSGHKINITYFERHADMRHFIKNGEWEVESALLYNNILKHYGPNKLPYPDVTLTLKIKRRSVYYCVYIVLPSAIISLLSLLTFILPTDNGERISLVNGILVANSVYILVVFSMLPETSEAIPVLGKYLFGNTSAIVLCLCATCASLKCYGQTRPMSTIWEKIFCVKFEEDNSRSGWIQFYSDNENEESHTDDIALENMSTKLIKSFEAALHKVIRPFTEELSSKHEHEKVVKKWKSAAKFLDRVFLIFFF
jgi:hypothetical protein